MNIHHYERKHLFAQHQILDAFGDQRITTIMRSDDLRVDSFGSLFGRSPTSSTTSVYREHQRRCNRTCIAPLSQREGRITNNGSNVNYNVTSSSFSGREILTRSQERSFSSSVSSQQREEHLSVSENECYEDGDGIYTALSALLDEFTTHEICKRNCECPLKEREQ